MGGLTTHSTGAELACLSSSTWMLFADTSRPVNSGVRCCAASDSLNLLTLRVAARAIEYFGELNGLTLRVLSMLNDDARPTAIAVRSRRSAGRIV